MLNHDKNKNDPTLRICDVCGKRKPRELGKYAPISELRQKWFCQHCYDIRKRL